MEATDVLKTLRELRDVSFATVDAHGCPRIRTIDVMLVEGTSLYFCTARGKDVHAEIMAMPCVAIGALTSGFVSISLHGTARRLPDEEQPAWIDRIFAENPGMVEVYPGDARYILEAFVIESGTIDLFDLSRPAVSRASLAFGSATIPPAGFTITDACIGCGTCVDACPQKCVEAGVPFTIIQEHCLRCGRCAEHCPAGAIERMHA